MRKDHTVSGKILDVRKALNKNAQGSGGGSGGKKGGPSAGKGGARPWEGGDNGGWNMKGGGGGGGRGPGGNGWGGRNCLSLFCVFCIVYLYFIDSFEHINVLNT